MEENKITEKNDNIHNILSDSITDLESQNKEAYNILIEKTKQDFFEQHQTTGTLKKLAGELLDTIKEDQDEN